MKSYTYIDNITNVEHNYGCKVTKKSRINRQKHQKKTIRAINLWKNLFLSLKNLEESKNNRTFAFSYQNGDDAVPLYRNLGGWWWRRLWSNNLVAVQAAAVKCKMTNVKRIKAFSIVFQGKTLWDPDRVTNKSDSHFKSDAKLQKISEIIWFFNIINYILANI